MKGHEEGTVAAFFQRFRRSPVRWVALVHAVSLIAAIVLLMVFSSEKTLYLLDASLVLAQISLLLIWMSLDGAPTLLRVFVVSFALSLIYLVHLPVSWYPEEWLHGFVCLLPGTFLTLTVYALLLSLAQHGMRLRLRRFHPSQMPLPARLQFALRALLWTTAGWALLFGIKPLSLISGHQAGRDGLGIVNDGIANVARFIAVCATSAVILSVPPVCVWVALTPGKILPRLMMAIVGWLLGGILILHYVGPLSQPLDVFVPFVVGTLIMLGTLFLLRHLGYRVVRLDQHDWLPVSELGGQDGLG